MGIVDFFSGYGAYHHNKVNQWIHIICVPMILACSNGHGEYMKIDALGHEINWVLAINTCAMLFYLNLHFVGGLVVSTWMYTTHFVFTQELIASESNAHFMIGTLHALSWIAQFVGHGVFEGRKPALFDNILQVFSAPLFVTLEVLFMLGFYPELRVACERAVLAKLPKKNN